MVRQVVSDKGEFSVRQVSHHSRTEEIQGKWWRRHQTRTKEISNTNHTCTDERETEGKGNVTVEKTETEILEKSQNRATEGKPTRRANYYAMNIKHQQSRNGGK
jgi:hypothetical protein